MGEENRNEENEGAPNYEEPRNSREVRIAVKPARNPKREPQGSAWCTTKTIVIVVLIAIALVGACIYAGYRYQKSSSTEGASTEGAPVSPGNKKGFFGKMKEKIKGSKLYKAHKKNGFGPVWGS